VSPVNDTHDEITGVTMSKNIYERVLEELDDVASKIAANAFSTISVSFIVHDGEIVRVKRGIEVQAKTEVQRDRGMADGR
jgi:hypothetical protein